MAQLSVSPVAKHRRSSFGFEPSYEKRWDCAIQLHVLQQKTPHRYQQSPVFTRKTMSDPTEEETQGRHHHHKHHKHHKHTRRQRKRVISESSSSSSSSDERVHLLSSLPWRKSDSSDSSSEGPVIDCTPKRQNLFNFSQTLPHRLHNKLQYENKENTQKFSPGSSPLFRRRANSRSRSEGSSPHQSVDDDYSPVAMTNPTYVPLNATQPEPEDPQPSYRGQLVIDVQAAVFPISSVLSPDSDSTTPLAASNEFLEFVNSEEGFPAPPSPHTLRFLGISVEVPREGLSEEEILRARLSSRRFSTSSDSSTSTLTG